VFEKRRFFTGCKSQDQVGPDTAIAKAIFN